MFSTTTIESSTSRPSASTNPAIESWFSEKPVKYSGASPIANDSGIEIITTSACAQAEREQRQQHERNRDREVEARAA